jgi:hypothetical protein
VGLDDLKGPYRMKARIEFVGDIEDLKKIQDFDQSVRTEK